MLVIGLPVLRLVVVFISTVAICCGCEESTTLPALPDPLATKEIRATLYNSPERRADIAEFSLPVQYNKIVINSLKPSKISLFIPRSADRIGSLTIIDNDNHSIRIHYYWTGKNPLIYSVEGPTFIEAHGEASKDGGLLLDHLLREAYAELNNKGSR